MFVISHVLLVLSPLLEAVTIGFFYRHQPDWKDLIKTINAWRGILALIVAMYHCGLPWLRHPTMAGVAFFFIASAFLLSMRHPFDRLTDDGYRRFVVNHAARLYPLHWLGMILLLSIALAFGTTIDWGATALCAMLLHSWSPIHEVHYTLNPATWFLCVLLFCYVVYPFISHAMGRLRLPHKALVTVILVAALMAILVPLDLSGRETVLTNPLSHVVDIVVGITLFHLYHALRKRYPRVAFGTATLIEAGALLSLVAVMVVNVTTTWLKPWEDLLIWMAPQGVILVTMALLNGQEGALGRLLLCKPLQWLGDISFEIYVLHFAAFHLFNYVLAPVAGHFGLPVYHLLPWFAMPVTLLLAWAVHRWFTQPLMLRRKPMITDNRQ